MDVQHITVDYVGTAKHDDTAVTVTTTTTTVNKIGISLSLSFSFTHTYTHTYIHTHTHIYTHTCTHTHTRARTHTHAHMRETVFALAAKNRLREHELILFWRAEVRRAHKIDHAPVLEEVVLERGAGRQRVELNKEGER